MSLSNATKKVEFWILLLATVGGAGFYWYKYHKQSPVVVPMDRNGRRRARNPGHGSRSVAVELGNDGGGQSVLPGPGPGARKLLGGDDTQEMPSLGAGTGGRTDLDGQYLQSMRSRSFHNGLQSAPISSQHIVPRAVVDDTPVPGSAMAPQSHSSLYANHTAAPQMISRPVLTKCYTPFAESCTRECGTELPRGEWPESMYVHGQSKCERFVKPFSTTSTANMHTINGGAEEDGFFNVGNNALLSTINSANELPSQTSDGMLPGME